MKHEYSKMLEDCEARDSLLVGWERGVIRAVRWNLDRGQIIVETTGGVFHRIWDRVKDEPVDVTDAEFISELVKHDDRLDDLTFKEVKDE